MKPLAVGGCVTIEYVLTLETSSVPHKCLAPSVNPPSHRERSVPCVHCRNHGEQERGRETRVNMDDGSVG